MKSYLDTYNNCSASFWGTPDTQLTFCEAKYQNKYIAEYYNTFSALSYVLVGYLLYLKKFKDMGVVVILLGIGTMIMHATLRWYGQWMDEICMLIIECFSIRDLTHQHLLMNVVALLIIIMYVWLQNKHYFISMFIVMLAIIGYLTKDKLSSDRNVILYTIMMSIACACWFLDQFMCNYVQEYQLHAIWHVGTALAIYFGYMSLI